MISHQISEVNNMPMTKSDWETLTPAFEKAQGNKPSAGRRVKVCSGKKHLGESGVVTWHGKDKFGSGDRYHSDVQAALSNAIGRIGYRVRIQPENGEPFFVSADYVEIAETAA
jgi:hypothetical protein